MSDGPDPIIRQTMERGSPEPLITVEQGRAVIARARAARVATTPELRDVLSRLPLSASPPEMQDRLERVMRAAGLLAYQVP